MQNILSNLKTVLLQKNPYYFSYLSPSWYAELLSRSLIFRDVFVSKTPNIPIYVVISSDVELDIPCQGDPSCLSLGINKGLPILLDLLRKFDAEGTFFVEAMTGQYFPKIFDLISDQGHEVGSHAYSHYENYARDKYVWGRFARPIGIAEMQRLIHLSKRMIEKTSGKKIFSFRAPFARIDGQVFEILSKEGFLFDSSIPNGVFGRISPYRPDPKRFWEQGGSKILEIPMSGRPLPSFSHFLKQEPYRTFRDLYVEDIEEAKRAFNQLIAMAECVGKPAIIHITSHPWEFVNLGSRTTGTITGQMRIKRLQEFLLFMKQLGVHFVSLKTAGVIWNGFQNNTRKKSSSKERNASS
jgi:peptidoglycan/xylan/chitin deacetylase (PgdA/CDA1 family)